MAGDSLVETYDENFVLSDTGDGDGDGGCSRRARKLAGEAIAEFCVCLAGEFRRQAVAAGKRIINSGLRGRLLNLRLEFRRTDTVNYFRAGFCMHDRRKIADTLNFCNAARRRSYQFWGDFDLQDHARFNIVKVLFHFCTNVRTCQKMTLFVRLINLIIDCKYGNFPLYQSLCIVFIIIYILLC